jgi:hypothetical protein
MNMIARTTMSYSLSRTLAVLGVATAVLGLAGNAAAQATSTTRTVPGAATASTTQLRGEVAYIQGDYLIARMIPSGDYRLFQLRPGKTATIDGAVMPLNKVRLGTVLTAYVTVTERSVVDRTVTTLRGTVWYATPKNVILTLENGENREYEVPAGLKFNVDGQMKEAQELRPGMKVTATKVVEAPRTEITEGNVVTGVSPK